MPMPADKLFGTSNPSSEIRYGRTGFIAKTGANFTGKGKGKYVENQDGSKNAEFELEVGSDPTSVIDAEGNRIPKMEATRLAEFQMIAQMHQADMQFFSNIVQAAASVAPMFIQKPQSNSNNSNGPSTITLDNIRELMLEFENTRRVP